jgi:hypothetical protein
VTANASCFFVEAGRFQPGSGVPYFRVQPLPCRAPATQPGSAAVRAPTAARTLSLASSSWFSPATAATTCAESVRCFPPAFTSPPAESRFSSASSGTCSSPASATSARNPGSTEWPDPGSSSGRPSRYFQSSRVRTASAAIRPVRFPARGSTVTSASRDGGQPGRPRIPNAAANSSSPSHSPSRSRTVTASGSPVFRDPYIAPIAAATTGSGSGHGTGCTDMTCPFCSQDKRNNSGLSSTMATITARSENTDRRAVNKPPGSP